MYEGCRLSLRPFSAFEGRPFQNCLYHTPYSHQKKPDCISLQLTPPSQALSAPTTLGLSCWSIAEPFEPFQTGLGEISGYDLLPLNGRALYPSSPPIDDSRQGAGGFPSMRRM
jgi:hypothetical protein